MNTAEIMAALRKRYPAPEFAFFAEVPNATGGGASRSADGLAISLWPSRGLEITGFEVKASRSDWLREKSDPAKSETIQKFCDRWVLVVGDAAIVKDGELPPTWGLLVPRGKGLVIKVDAPKLTPVPVGRGFLASILRRAQNASPCEDELRAARKLAADEERERLKESHERDVARIKGFWDQEKEALRSLQDRVTAFEAASGVSLSDRGYQRRNDTPERIGKAVRQVLDGGLEPLAKHARELKASAEYLVRQCDDVVRLAEQRAAPVTDAERSAAE